MIHFDINQTPPSKAEIDEKLKQRREELSRFKRNITLATIGELSVMGLGYVAAFNLFNLGENMGVAVAVAVIGPVVALICILIATSLRHRELSYKLRALLPPEPGNASASLKGRNCEVDSYLERLSELGRDLTQTEFVKLERHCKTYG